MAALILFALLAWSSGAIRGLILGLAAAAKFAPLVLAPLLLRGPSPSRRDSVLFLGGLVLAIAVTVAAYLPDGGIGELYDATIGYQLGRESPFSPWGLHPGLDWLQAVVKVAACALALVVAALPRERDLLSTAALAGAVIIAVQLAAEYWFYTYIVWFAPLALIACMGGHRVAAQATLSSRRRLAW